MIQTHTNTDNTLFTYTNTNTLGQNVFFTGTGGAGNQSSSTTTSGNTQYYTQGAVGVSLQVFVNDVLVESIAGGNGNISTIADIKKHVRTENHRYTVGCGFLNLKRCWRDNYVQIWEWGHNRRAVTHRAEGQTKSFVLNIPPQGVLRVEFSGSSDSEHKGCCSISVLDKPLSLPFKPVDTNGIEWVEQEESPQDSQDSQESPQESAPNDTDSQTGEQIEQNQTEQGEQTPQEGQAESTPQENTNPQENGGQDQTDSTDSAQGSQNAESNTEQGQTEQESQGGNTPQTTPPAQDSTEQAGMTREQALKIIAQNLAGILKRGLEYIRNNPNKQTYSDEITTTLYYHAIRMAYRNKKVGAVERDIELNELLAKLEPAITYNDAFPVFKHIGELYTQDDEIGRQAHKVITQEDYQGLCALPLPQLESYGTGEG